MFELNTTCHVSNTQELGVLSFKTDESGKAVILKKKKTHLFLISLALSNPIFLPTAYSPALIYCGRERGWWITRLKSVLHEEVSDRLLQRSGRTNAKKKVMDRLLQRSGRTNAKKSVGRHPTSERNGKIMMSDKVRRRNGKG